MVKTVLPLLIFFSFYLNACGHATLSKNHHTTTLVKMDTSKLSHPAVKAAFDAWLKGDSKTFISFFIPGRTLYAQLALFCPKSFAL